MKKKLLKVAVKYDGPVEAPIKKDQKIATLRVVYEQELVGEYDLLSSKEIKKGFESVTVFTVDGKQFTGLIEKQNATQE